MPSILYYSVENGVIYVRDHSGVIACFDTMPEFKKFVRNTLFADSALPFTMFESTPQ